MCLNCSCVIVAFVTLKMTSAIMCMCLCTFICICICDFWLYECVGSSVHTSIKYTHAGSHGLDSSCFRLWRPWTPLSHTALQRAVIHSCVLHDSKPFPCLLWSCSHSHCRLWNNACHLTLCQLGCTSPEASWGTLYILSASPQLVDIHTKTKNCNQMWKLGDSYFELIK